MSKQTAVEWLIDKIYFKQVEVNRELLDQALEMEKQQTIDAWDKGDYCIDLPDGTWEQKYKSGEDYYNETYK